MTKQPDIWPQIRELIAAATKAGMKTGESSQHGTCGYDGDWEITIKCKREPSEENSRELDEHRRQLALRE